MRVKLKIILLIVMVVMSFAACATHDDVEITQKVSKKAEEQVIEVTRLEVESIIYGDFENVLESAYGLEPYYTAEDWMDKDGKLLHPYANNKELMTGVGNIMASIYMPEKVLEKASTEDLLKVVCDGWFSTNVTLTGLFNNASDYVKNSVVRNQATNELVRRSDMTEVLFEDYCNREYVKGTEYSDEAALELKILQFDEIVLGSNHAFSIMTDDMKSKVLEEVLKKNKDIQSGEYYNSGHQSGFFSIIEEEYINGGSDWYTYICEKGYDEAKEYINTESAFWR